MNFFLIHGSKENPTTNWFPWLKQQLEDLGQEVIAPSFPNPPNQSVTSWLETIQPDLGKVDAETVFVGHSLGPAFTLSVLEKIGTKVSACFFVAGFLGPLGLTEYDPINKTFTEKDFNWKKIKANCKKFVCYASDNDPYVPLSNTKGLAKKLGAELIIVKGAGHFTQKSGYATFDQLLEKINKTCVKKK